MNKKERGSFTGGIGFVLAAAGSAVGLGNLLENFRTLQHSMVVVYLFLYTLYLH